MKQDTPRVSHLGSRPQSGMGFTLVELLVVLTIIGAVVALAAAAITSIMGARQVSSGAYDVQQLVELARNEAMTRQTYVWIGCLNTRREGEPEVDLAAVYSRDGSTNSVSSNLLPLAKPLRIAGVMGIEWNALKESTRALFTNAVPKSVMANGNGITFSVNQARFAGATLTFTPRGEALLKGAPGPDDGYDASIDISLRRSRGGAVRSDSDDAAVVIDGATGNPQLIRLQ